jgi:sugar phosphate isomerase/epimerase
MNKQRLLRLRSFFFIVAICLFSLCIDLMPSGSCIFAQQKSNPSAADLFRRENLMAWCIVPFDSQKRTPKQRALMLKELGISKFAYDYRAEHIPTFEEEIVSLQEQGIELSAWWFPTQLNDEAKGILALLKKHHVTPQLWVMGGGNENMSPEEVSKFMASEVVRLRTIADAANEVGCKVGLYNHGGWFGVPENMTRLLTAIDRPNVGIVYNLHHAHGELDRLPEVLKLLTPHLYVLNVNGMQTHGDKVGKKIMVIGEGDRDRDVFQAIARSGYQGPIGILNHTNEDAYSRLNANLEGLQKVVMAIRQP